MNPETEFDDDEIEDPIPPDDYDDEDDEDSDDLDDGGEEQLRF